MNRIGGLMAGSAMEKHNTAQGADVSGGMWTFRRGVRETSEI